MKFAIKGLTGRTLTFNTIGLILRGKEASIVNADTSEKEREVKSLEKLGLLSVININEDETSEIIEKVEKVENKDTQEITIIPSNDSSIKTNVEIEDFPSKVEKIVEEVNESEHIEKTKEINNALSHLEIPNEPSNVTVSLGNRTITREIPKSICVNESENKVEASLEAMKKLQEEEAEKFNIDEEIFEENGKMGRSATISVGEGEIGASKMKNSIVPDIEIIKKRDPFIDRDAVNETSNDAFVETAIEHPNDAEEAEYGEQFIEI